MTSGQTICPTCAGTGWVCEDHPFRPWEGPHACGCGAAGAPCPVCNEPIDGGRPRLPDNLEQAIISFPAQRMPPANDN